MLATARRSGSVKYFNVGKGYGFIAPAEGEGASVFFHLNDWTRENLPRVGDRVSFILAVDRDRRPCAQRVA